MNPATSDQRPADAGFRALVWMASLAAVLIVIWLVMMYLAPAPSGLGPWTYPGATQLVTTNNAHLQHQLLSAPAPLNSVMAWYDKKLAMENAVAGFSMSGGLFGARRQQVKISLSGSGTARGSWYCELSEQGMTAAMISPGQEETTIVTLLRLTASFANSRSGNQAATTLNALAYPAAKRGSGGGAGGVSAFQFTALDPLERVTSHYLEKFGAPAGATPAPGATLTTGSTPKENQIVRLSEPIGAGSEQTTLLVRTPTNLCFLHFSRATNAATDMILGVFQ